MRSVAARAWRPCARPATALLSAELMRISGPSTARALCLVGGCATASAVWLAALPLRGGAAEAALHVGMVCLAAPLLAASAAGSRVDPVTRRPSGFSPLTLALLHWAVVWTWHAPAVRLLARGQPQIEWLQAASILMVGVMLWLSVLGGREARYERVGVGIIALLTTSIHMTVLGGLSLIRSAPLPAGAPPQGGGALGSSAAVSETLAGLVLLAGAGVVYTAAGALLVAWLLHPKARIGERDGPVTTAGYRS